MQTFKSGLISVVAYGAFHLVERQNEKRGLESGFGSAGYVNEMSQNNYWWVESDNHRM